MLVLGDLLSETDEHFTVTLRGPSNATLADATATGTIRDDDDRATPGNTFRDCAVCPQMVTLPAELVQDCYEDTPGATCSGRVVRGGSWASGPERLRSAYRGWCAPTLRNHLNGFRVARSAP